MGEDDANPLELPGLDITGDGQITIADIPAWATHLLLLPGDAGLALLIEHVPAVAGFFELDRDDYGGTLSITASVVIWIVALVLLGLLVNAIRNLMRTLTSCLLGRFNELRRLGRIARRRITSWLGMRRQRRRAESPAYAVDELELERIDNAVLRCYADTGEKCVVAVEEVAARLRLSIKQVQTALRRLGDYRLVESASISGGGRQGHHITQAGQIYLIEH